jgi:hypothetical protein
MTIRIPAGHLALLSLVFLNSIPAEETRQLISTGDIETLCQRAAEDAKQFLRVAFPEGQKYRDLSTWVLQIQNTSKRFSFSRNPQNESEALIQFSQKLSGELAQPGRVETEYFTVAPPNPSSATWQRLTQMAQNPRKDWIDTQTRIANKVGWIVYGTIIDVPGKEKPYALLKMTDVAERVLVWGGCFSMLSTERKHQADICYPECQEITRALKFPTWARPEPGENVTCTYWSQSPKAQDAEESIFADLLVIEFLRNKTVLPNTLWIDPALIRRYVQPAKEAGDAPAPEPPAARTGLDHAALAELYRSEDWQRLQVFVTGAVDLNRPRVKSALLKSIKLVPSERNPKELDAFVLSGFCSEARQYQERRDWVRRAIELGLKGSAQAPRVLRVTPSEAFPDAEAFQDITEIAIAWPELPACRVVAHSSPDTGAPNHLLLTHTDENDPPRALYVYLIELATQNFIWSARQGRLQGEAPDPSYLEYCNKVQIVMRGGASEYGQHLSFLWFLRPRGDASTKKIGSWSLRTTGLQLATTLIDPSRPFLHSIGNQVFGEGDSADLLRATEEVQKTSNTPIRAITFQLLPRKSDQRPALVVKYITPANGRIDWAYYDEPPGTPLSVPEEDDILEKIRKAVEDLQKSPVAEEDEPQATLVQRAQTSSTLNLGSRPHELLLSQLALRRRRPPVDWDYLVASRAIQAGTPPAESPTQPTPDSLFSKDLEPILEKLHIASLIQSEWVPAYQPSKKYPNIPPRQLLLWETSRISLTMERFVASPASDLTEPEEASTSPGNRFLHHAAHLLLHGAENTYPWENLEGLNKRSPLLHTLLQTAIRDYQIDPSLTQNIVIQTQTPEERITLISTGTTEQTATAGNRFPGLLRDPHLSGAKKETFALAFREFQIKHDPLRIPDPASITRIGQIFPPDWRENYPNLQSLLNMEDPLAIVLLRRNIECQGRQADLTLFDTSALRLREKNTPPSTPTDPASIAPELLQKHGDEWRVQTVLIPITLNHLRAFPIQDADQNLYLVHSMTVHVTASTSNLILRSIPDTFRYFLTQKISGETATSIRDALKNPITQALEADIKQVQTLLLGKKTDEAYSFLERLMTDLATWSSRFPILRETIPGCAEQAAAEIIKSERDSIRALREKVTSPKHDATLRKAQEAAKRLLENLDKWSAQHPSLKEKAREAVIGLAQDAVIAHKKAVIALLDALPLETAPEEHPQKVDKGIEAARFITSELVKELNGLKDREKSVISQAEAPIKEMATRFVNLHKNWFPALGPKIDDMKTWKKEDKALKAKAISFLKEEMENCLDDLGAWSRTFPGLKGLVDAEGAAVPIEGKPYGLKHWEKGVPPQSLKNAIPTAAEALKKL